MPAGLINTSVGGSAAEAWISPEALKEFPHYLKHNRISDAAAERGKQESFAAIMKSENIKPERFPSNLYNAMLAPLIPYGTLFKTKNITAKHQKYHRRHACGSSGSKHIAGNRIYDILVSFS
ncbi:MAG: hypothetical protein ACYCZO_15630 [Daejeonella sp.]